MTIIATEGLAVEKYPNNQNVIQTASKEEETLIQESTCPCFPLPQPRVSPPAASREKAMALHAWVSVKGGQ